MKTGFEHEDDLNKIWNLCVGCRWWLYDVGLYIYKKIINIRCITSKYVCISMNVCELDLNLIWIWIYLCIWFWNWSNEIFCIFVWFVIVLLDDMSSTFEKKYERLNVYGYEQWNCVLKCESEIFWTCDFLC